MTTYPSLSYSVVYSMISQIYFTYIMPLHVKKNNLGWNLKAVKLAEREIHPLPVTGSKQGDFRKLQKIFDF